MNRGSTIPSADLLLLHSDHDQSFRLDPDAFLVQCILSCMHVIFYIRYLGHGVSDSAYPGPTRIPTRRVSRQQRIVAL